ncbi:MAG: carboxypeptidase regulatory-like domain-containing protein [Archangium sp.]
MRLLFVCAALGALVGCNRNLDLPPQPQFASLAGAIDTDGHLPPENNAIRLINASTGVRFDQQTDAEGKFLFGNLAPGNYLVQADVEGFAPLREGPFNVPSGNPIDVGIFKLVWLGQTEQEGSISGSVVVSGGSAGMVDGGSVDAGVDGGLLEDGGTGRPSDAQGATVSLLLERMTGEPVKVAETPVDAFGRFSARVPPGRYTIEATHPWYVSARRQGVLLAEGQLLQLLEPLVLELNPADVSGEVALEVESLSGGSSTSVTAGITVTSDTGRSVTTDNQGRYTLPGLAAGTRRLTFSFPGFHDSESIRTIDLAAGEHATYAQVKLLLNRGDISGRVRMSDGSQLDDVSVAIAGAIDGGVGGYTTQAVRSMADPASGDFILRGVPVGSYNVVAHRTNYVDATSPTVTVQVGSITPLASELRLARLQGDFLIEDSDPLNTAGFTRERNVTLVLSNVMSAAEFRAVEGTQQDLMAAAWQPYSLPRIPFTLSSGDGPKTIYLQIKNTMGNEGPALSATIILDTTPPNSGEILLHSGAGFTRIANPLPVTLSALDVGGVAQVRLASIDPDAGVTFEDGGVPMPDAGFPLMVAGSVGPYVRDTSFTRPTSADGVQTVAAQFVDNAGNPSDVALATIVVDTVPPTGSLTVVRGARASVDGYTNTLLVELAEMWGAEPNGGYVQVRLANDSVDLSSAVAQPTRARASWFLDAQGEGQKTVHYLFIDAAGNQAGAGQATIIYDATAPLVTANLTSGSPTSNPTVTISLNTVETSPYSPDAGVSVAQSAIFTNAVVGPYPSNNTVNYTLSPGDGPRNVFVRVRDAAGNDGTASVSLELDTTPPTGLGISLVGALDDGTPSATLTSDPVVTVNLTQSGATQVLLGDGSLTSCPAVSGTWRNITGTSIANHPLAGTGSVRTVTACFADGAGNVAGPVSATINYDGAAPSGCQLALTGLRTNGNPSGVSRTALRSIPYTLTNCAETPLEIALTEQTTVLCDATAAGLVWSPYSATANQVTLSSVDGTKTVRGCVRDAARNTTSFVAGTMTLDTSPPTSPRVSINSGAAYINAQSVDAGVAIATVTGTALDATEWAFAEEGTTPSNFVSYTTANPGQLALSGGDGTKTVKALFRDDLGNTIAAEVADSIEVDTTPPTLSSIALLGTLADGTSSTALTAVTDVTATLVQSGATSVFFGNASLVTCPTTGHSQLVGNTATVTLTGTGTTRTVKACVGDAAGNLSALRTATIDLDATAPTGCALSLTGLRADDASPTSGVAAGLTGRRDVRFTLTGCTETPAQIALTQSGVSCAVNANLVWAPYDALATNSFTLAGVDGSKTVQGCVRDAARNPGGLTAATITLDTTPPSGASVSLDTGAAYVNAAQKAARGNVNRASAQGTVTSAYEWALAENAVPSVWRVLSSNNPFNFDFSTGDGVKTVRVLFRDEVGNVTANEVSDSIEFDTVAPTLTSVTVTGTLADGTPSSVSTTTTNVTATILHGGGTSVAFGSTAGLNCTTASYSSFSGTTVATTLGGSGSPRTLAVCVTDAAGNPAGPVSTTIGFDSTGPTGCTLLMSGRKADGSATALDMTALRDVPFTLTGCVETVTEVSLTEAATVNCSGNLDWRPLTGADLLTLSEVDGLKTVRGCVRDASRNVGSLSADSITLDTTPPSAATVTIKAGAAYFNRADFLAAGSTNTISVSGSSTDAVDWAIAESATPSSFGALVATNFVFSAGDGVKTISALFRDALGNVTPVTVTDTITIDTQNPTLSAINVTGTLADGTASDVTTSTASVQLSLTHVDGVGIFVGDATLASCPTSGYASFGGGSSATITLPGSGTPRTVRVCVADVAGNVAGYQQDTIGFDSSAPTSCALTLVGRRTNGTNTSGATANKTALTGVGVTLSGCSETPTEVYLVEAGSVGCSATSSLSWQPYVVGSTNFTLTGGDANKTVVGCVRDAARNVSSVTFDDIALDTTPPTLASITLAAGATYFNRASWLAAPNANTMNLNATVTGAADWAWAENTTPTTFNAASFPVNQNVTLSVGDGIKTVRALFRDDVGNTTPAEVSDTIEVDTQVPTLSSIVINGTLADGTTSTASSSSTSVNVTLNQSGATLAALGDSTFTCPTSVAGFSSFNGISASTTLTDSSATRTVRACVADAAGNISATVSSTIQYDAAAPTGCVLTLGGRRTDGSSTAATSPEKTALTAVTAALSSCSEAAADIYLVESSGAVSCPAAGSAAWTSLSGGSSIGFSLSAGDALKTVKACVRDATRNVSAASFTDTITLDTTPPTGASVSLHAGADYFNRTAWLAQGSINRMGVTGTAAGATEWAWSEFGTPTTFGAFTSPTTVQNTFTAGEGTRKVYALFRDDVGNTTSEVNDGIEVDVTAPTLSSLTLVGTLGDGTSSTVISSTTSVTANVVQSGATSIATGDGTFTCPNGTTFTAFNGSSASVTLPGSGTTRTMRACVADLAGNASGVVQDTIDFDGASPSGCALVMTGRRVDGVATGGGQADLTALRDVGVSLSGCIDTNVEVALTESPSITCSNTAGLSWISLTGSTTFQISAGDGSKTVRGCVRDPAYNVGSLATDAITLDTTPPDNATVSLNGTGGYANTFSRIASGSADNATEWAVATTSTGPFTFGTYSTTPSTQGVNYALPDGTKFVYARFRDALLNTTNTVSASIVIDTTPPTAPVILTVDSQNRGARLFWDPSTDATAGVAAYELLADPSGTPTTVRTTTGGGATSGYVLNLENRTDNVFAVRAVDFAGNRSALSSLMSTTVGWKRITVSPGSIYPIRPLDVAIRGPHIFVTFMDTDSNWSGIAGNLRMAVSHDSGETWAFKTLDSGFGGGRQLAPIRFSDDAVWVATVSNPGLTSDMIAGNVALYSSTDNGDTWSNVSDTADLNDPNNYGKVDSLSLLTSGSSMRAFYFLASSSAAKRQSVVSSSAPSFSTWQSAAYHTTFGSAPYQVTNGLRSCAGNFSSIHLWRDRSNPNTNAPNLVALTHYFLPDLTYDSTEGSAAFITSGVGTGQEVGNIDMACTSLSETMQSYVVFDRAPAAAWAVGANGVVLRYDDTAWVTASSPTQRTIYSVQDVWALGQGYTAGGTNYSLILRYNGSVWEELQSTAAGGQYLYDSYTASTNAVYAVGGGGVVIKWDGSSWASMTSATGQTLNGVWGTSATNVYAVGYSGVVQRYNGTSWATQTSATANVLRAIWGSSATNIWAVGDSGTIVRSTNGTSWVLQSTPTGANLQSIWGSSASDIWAVGSGGVIIHYNGSTWSTFSSPTANQLNEVSGVSANDVWAVGIGGTALHFTGSTWTPVATETTGTLYSVWWGGSSGGPAANLYGMRKLGSLQSFTSPVALRTDADRTMSPHIWAGGRNVYVLYRNTADKLMLGESTDEGASFSNWTTLEAGANKGLYAALSGDNSADVAVAFTDINAATMTVMIPSVPSFPLTPIAGVGTSSLTWSSVPGVDRYQIDSDPDGALPWANTDFTSQTQATIPTPPNLAPFVQVRPVDDRGMPGNTGEVWQVRPFNEVTLTTVNNAVMQSSNTGGIVAYNDKVLVWPPRPMANGMQVYRSSNYGANWSSYTPAGTISASGPRAIAGFNGRAAMFYQDGSATTTLRVQTFSDIGVGTATLGTIQAGVNLDFIAAKTSIDNSGLVVAYADATNDLIRVATTDATMAFTIRTSISTTAANTIGALEVAKVDFSTNRVVITWREYTSADPRTDTIRMAESLDRGATWGPATTLLSGTSSPSGLSATYDIGSTDLSGSNNGAYSVLARTSEFNDFYHKPANLWLTVTGTDHSTNVSSSTYVQVKLDSETVDPRAFDAFGNSDGHYLAWRAESLDGTVAKLRFAYCFSDCHLFSRWDRSLLKVWTSYVRDQGRYVDMTVSQASPGYDPAIYVLYTEASLGGLYRDVKVLTRGVHRRTR